ncbi:MAG: hypothetical protein R3F48_00860 [Candidatus Zixiibacteriota bacterium]
MSDSTEYNWYKQVNGKDPLEQGDIILDCPIITPPDKITVGKHLPAKSTAYDVIIMSQSCDLAARKIRIVQVCPIYCLEELSNLDAKYRNVGIRNNLRKGKIITMHMLHKCENSKFNDFLIVDFGSTFGVNINFLFEYSQKQKDRIRLLPPYREHLSQSFARFFMRVGLPSNIPEFT